jgi:hypothetical protein
VTLEVECVDRAYLNLYIPRLMYPLGVVGFFKHHRGMPFASGVLMDPVTKAFVASIHRYIKDDDLDPVQFVKGERKDDVALRYLAGHDGTEQILFVGRRKGSPNSPQTRSLIFLILEQGCGSVVVGPPTVTGTPRR